MADAILVDDWATYPINPFLAPESGGAIGLTGKVAPGADLRRPDGGPISTSAIVAVEGEIVTTRSGTRYRLGQIKAEFVEWMREQGIEWDAGEPIKVGRRHPRKEAVNG